VEEFLEIIGTPGRQLVKNISFVLANLLHYNGSSHSKNAMVLLRQCKALRSLTVEFPYLLVHGRYQDNLLRLAAVKELRKIRGCTEVHIVPSASLTQATVKEFETILKEELCREEGSKIDRIEQGPKNEKKEKKLKRKKDVTEMDQKWKMSLKSRADRQ